MKGHRRITFSCLFVLLLAGGCAENATEKTAAPDPNAGALFKDNPNAQIIKKELIRVSFKPGELASLCNAELKAFAENLDHDVKSAFDLDQFYTQMDDRVVPLHFMGSVSTDEKVRAEASTCEEKYNKALVEMFTRKPLYEIVKASTAQNPDEDRLISEFKRQFEKNGMQLNDKDLAAFRDLKSKLVTLEAQFSKNLNEDTTSVEFTAAELEGTSPDFLERQARNKDGKYVVTTKLTDYLHVMENAKNPEARKKMAMAFENRAATANTKLLEQAVVLREQIAKLLGYKVWADYRIKGNMARNSEQVNTFLIDLKKKLRPRLTNDLRILLDAKRKMENPQARELTAWDFRYFENQVKKRDYALDEEVVREYLPKDTVMAGIFEIYSTLLGVKFEEVAGAAVWASDVKLYAIRDTGSKQIIGYFYTDFVPRPGKYGHAAAFPLIHGHVTTAGYYSQPVSAIVANFTPPSGGKPSLMTHDEVEVVFHEFGHIMHQTLTHAPYGWLSGSAVAQDFVEAPSQMLENWVWDPTILKKISGHYADKTKKMPDNLIAKIVSTRDFNKGYFYSRQITFGLTDMAMHTATGPVDVTETYKKIYKEVMTVPAVEGSHFSASFGHLMGGYDAGYYGYIWSEVFAADMFTTFQKDGLLNAKVGEKYRATILEQGNMLDAIDLLGEFLGRQPNNEAFLKKLKI
jgi:thimet oligopeptidase